MQIVPGILERDWARVYQRLGQLSDVTDWAHLDVCDGKFASPPTWSNPDDLWSAEISIKNFEVHLMIEKPWESIGPWLRTPISRFIFHVETFEDSAEHLQKAEEMTAEIHSLQKEALLALKIETPLNGFSRYASNVDGILLMAHVLGVSGVPFDENVIPKIATLHRDYPDLVIEVDGGIDVSSILLCKEAGARRAVATSYISKGEPEERMRQLMAAAGEIHTQLDKNIVP